MHRKITEKISSIRFDFEKNKLWLHFQSKTKAQFDDFFNIQNL